jgi:hypothetical protein
MTNTQQPKKRRVHERESTRYHVSDNLFGYKLLEATCKQHTPNGWVTLRLPDGTTLKCRSTEQVWSPSRLDAIDVKIRQVMLEGDSFHILDKLQQLFELRSQYREEWRFCPICDHQYEHANACQHVVIAYSKQSMDEAEQFGPIPTFSGIMQSEDLLAIFLVAHEIVTASLLTNRSWKKGLPRRVVSLLKTLVASIVGELPDDFCFTNGSISSAFDEYLQKIIRRGPTFQKTEEWEDRYGYGTYMTVVHWAKDAARCADYARKEIRSDVERLQMKLSPKMTDKTK